MIWSPLKQERGEIRLLTLCPGNFEQDIECKLRIISLDQDPNYVALSYCWGDPNDRATISLNEQDIPVTRSLATALKYMRRNDEEVILWNDATCINQNDEVEKGSQISLMGQIYAGASQAWVWLGESADGSDCAMDLLNSVTTMKLDDLDYQPDPNAWEAINCLFKRQWWTRLWVVQEILLARRTIVHCGEKAVDIEKFVHFKAMESRYRRRNGSRLQSIFSPMNHILWDWRRVRDSIANNRMTLFEMISLTGESKCQEKKDNIFALLGLCTLQESKYFLSYYRLPDRSLMVKAAQYFMNTRELRSPLKFLQTHQDGKTISLPSWVPDFTNEDVGGHLMIPIFRGYTPYKAGADNKAWTKLGLPALAPEILRRMCIYTFGPTLGLILGIIIGYISWKVTRRMNSASARFGDENSEETLVLSGLKVDVVCFASKMPSVEYYTGTDLKQDIDRKRKRRETTIAT